MELSLNGLKAKQDWQNAGVALPAFSIEDMRRETAQKPAWVHFGGGNIFRGFIAGLQQTLLEKGLEKTGVIVAESYDEEILEKIYQPYDLLTLMVTLLPDGTMQKQVIGSVAGAYAASSPKIRACFQQSSLQIASFTITEKGYSLYGIDGDYSAIALMDMNGGPAAPQHAMGIAASLLWSRFQSGAFPIAMVSMDNCSRNGEKFRGAVLEMARAWAERQYVSQAFLAYLEDESRVSFPWSMIDKITPRPDQKVKKQLDNLSVEHMEPVLTARKTYIAPFVNAEAPQYLVIEDCFPAGRPAFEAAGVYMTDQETVALTERMKVTTCLNPLHTALAIFGCLLGYRSIAAEMQDADLVSLIRQIGYQEGLPVVDQPGIIDPKAFLDEVVEKRFPNPFMPDTPQRIATDTSQKIPVRFGETIKSYLKRGADECARLTAIPLVLAGWLRYLLGVDDQGKPMEISPDPLLPQLKEKLAGYQLGMKGKNLRGIQQILCNQEIFGVNLYEAGLGEKVEDNFLRLLDGPGAVRRALLQLRRQAEPPHD